MSNARRLAPAALAVLIAAYGALLRADALVERYGPVERPGWARVLTYAAPAWAAHVKPSAHQWGRIDRPYVGGDPINYLRYAREMRTFYQPHVREPVFLAWTRIFLWALRGQDIAVSFASAAASVLAILGAYLLAASIVSPAAGVGVALLMATEYDVITWSVDGWRDDTFMAAVVFTAWAFVRLHKRPSFAAALVAGATAGIACLTRITALSFVVPGLILLAIGDQRQRRAWTAGLAALICGAIVAPYLISCAMATGDPFYAINYHTGFYRFGEGLPAQQPMSAATYLTGKLAAHPIRTLDTSLMGLTVQPFTTKFHGYEGYGPHIGTALKWGAAAGLVALAFVSAGRLLLVLLFASLIPYAFTWNVSSGGEWRFTMHAYPLYLTAAGFALDRAGRLVMRLWRDGAPARDASRRAIVHVAAAGAVLALGAVAYVVLPWFVVRESIALHEDVSIETGPRDELFFRDGWSAPHPDGVMVRVSRDDRATVRFPVPTVRSYDIVLRLDPVVPSRQRRFTVLINHQLLGSANMGTDPGRMGAYRLRLPASRLRVGSNELTIVPDTLVTRAEAGPRFGWLDTSARVGIRLWYVRVLAAGG